MRPIGLVVGQGDPVAAVTGVSADTILERCAAIRARRRDGVLLAAASADDGASSRPEPDPVPETMPEAVPRARRFIDLTRLSDVAFVVQAHALLLGRSPRPTELTRRTGQLASGKTRLEIVGRLALSKEGRTAPLPDVGGTVLPVLVRAARVLERSGLRAVRDWFMAFRQLGALRREVVALREEVRMLRQERRT